MASTSRVKKGLRRYGASGALRVAGKRVRNVVYMTEAHHWYQLDLAGERPRRDLPEGFDLVQANQDQLRLLDRLPTVKLSEGHQRLGDGATLWLVLEGENPAFACWTFYERMPVYAAKEGVLELPERTAGLEDSVTSPDYRGRGLAPAAWAAISDHLLGEGFSALITKVAEENQPSRRAVEKAGFEDIGVMRLTKLGLRRRVDVDTPGTGVAPYLRQALEG